MSAPMGMAGMLRRPPAPMSGPPAAGPSEAGPAGAAGGAPSELAQALHAANQLLAQAIQTGDIPPDALEQIQQFAELVAQFAQSQQGAQGQGAPPQGAPPQ